MRNLLFILLFYLLTANFSGVAAAQRITLSFNQAIEIIQKGIGAPAGPIQTLEGVTRVPATPHLFAIPAGYSTTRK